VANACRDRFRKNKAASVPRSVIKQLDDRERLVFKYYYQERLPHEDIAEIISRRHRVPYTALEVVRAIGKINDLLSTRKRWLLLSALRANMATLSIDEMRERMGYELGQDARADSFDQAMQEDALLQRLNQALDQLSPDDRMLIHLRFDHDRSAPQIGQLVKYDDHRYVYTRLRTIIQQLRRHMGMNDDPET
jgi:DNA-directed RNA polymerase specialized sigma subunit